MPTKSWVLVGSAAAVLAVGVAAGMRRHRPESDGAGPTPRPAYDYSEATSRPSEKVVDPRDELLASVDQWPSSGKDRALAMTDRLERVAERINAAGGSHCVVMLGQTGRVAVTGRNGIITVDTTALWRLSEEALAALLAHEIAHEVLGHEQQRELLEKDQGQPGYAQRVREMELAADEQAGRILARTGYGPRGFGEVLRYARSTEWEPPLVRQYYPHASRQAAFSGAFEREGRRPARVATATSRPAGDRTSVRMENSQ